MLKYGSAITIIVCTTVSASQATPQDIIHSEWKTQNQYTLTGGKIKIAKVVAEKLLARKLTKLRNQAQTQVEIFRKKILKDKNIKDIMEDTIANSKKKTFNITYGIGFKLDLANLLQASIPDLTRDLLWFSGHSKELKVIHNNQERGLYVRNNFMKSEYHPLVSKAYTYVPNNLRTGTTGGCAECAILMRFLQYFEGKTTFWGKRVKSTQKFPEKGTNYLTSISKAREKLKYTFFLTREYTKKKNQTPTNVNKISCRACFHVHLKIFNTYDLLRQSSLKISQDVIFREVAEDMMPAINKFINIMKKWNL